MKYRYLLTVCVVFIMAGCKKSEKSSTLKDAVTPDKTFVSDDDNTPKVCIDKSVPGHFMTGPVTEAVLFKKNKWPNGKVLRVKFLNGSAFLQAKVMTYAKAWEPYANITFVQVTRKKDYGEIRVGFRVDGDVGSWSYVGTDALLIDSAQQTINFGWFNAHTSDEEFSRTVTHEFGHAIGLVHEQSSPVEDILWNKKVVYKYFAGAPNYWSRAQVNSNIFFKYKAKQTQYTAFDPLSIMEYPVDPQFTTNGVGIGYNYYLSDMDKQFIATVYPKP